MIPEHQEPKLLPRDAKPIATFYEDGERRSNAETGSAALLAAVLKAQGKKAPTATPRLTVGDLAEVLSTAFTDRLTVDRIQKVVASFYGLRQSDLKAPDGANGTRSRELAHPRQVAMFMARELTGMSYTEIGRRFGGRDHTTVIHAMRAVRKRAENDDLFAVELDLLRIRLTGGLA